MVTEYVRVNPHTPYAVPEIVEGVLGEEEDPMTEIQDAVVEPQRLLAVTHTFPLTKPAE